LLSLVQRCGGCGTERSSEFGSVHLTRSPHARTRRELIQRGSEADRPARAAWSALRLLVDVVIFVLAKLLVGGFWFGADDGAQAVAADVGFAGSGRWCRRRSSAARYGVMTTDRKICCTYRAGACCRSFSAAAAAALNDHRNLAASTLLAAHTRAE
jgi:hypothetical protein